MVQACGQVVSQRSKGNRESSTFCQNRSSMSRQNHFSEIFNRSTFLSRISSVLSLALTKAGLVSK